MSWTWLAPPELLEPLVPTEVESRIMSYISRS